MFCEYSCLYRIGCSSDDLGEDDPIGWFELEEEWDEADVKLQQCRVAKVSISELFAHSPAFILCFLSGDCVSALCQCWNPRGESTFREFILYWRNRCVRQWATSYDKGRNRALLAPRGKMFNSKASQERWCDVRCWRLIKLSSLARLQRVEEGILGWENSENTDINLREMCCCRKDQSLFGYLIFF